MRKELKDKNEERTLFTAVVARFGTKANYHGYAENTMLLKNVRFAGTGEYATDHTWFTVGKTIGKLKLAVGDTIQFEARIGAYTKGYVNRRLNVNDSKTDYKLTRPTKFTLQRCKKDMGFEKD
jgi:hypothetical protein